MFLFLLIIHREVRKANINRTRCTFTQNRLSISIG
jgi:hypothetical protein